MCVCARVRARVCVNVCMCVLQGVEVLINCKSSGCDVCFLAAGRQPRCYLLAARTFSGREKESAVGFTVGI